MMICEDPTWEGTTIMQVNRQQLMEEGYNILRNVVPKERLEPLRRSIEQMVNRRKEISIQRRLPNEPPGGAWEASAQPRLKFDTDCDQESAFAIEFLLHQNTLGVSQQLMDAEQVVPHQFACLCSPVSRDFGPMRWHRDIGPGEPAPLRGMISNMENHGPSYLQWNIALYDDSVFWIVPRSHRRVNTDAETRQLAENPSVPLPGSMPVELNAGDGVVYTHLLFHWGSNYSRKMRRTLHPGYRPFGFAAFPNVHWRHWEPGFYHYLSDAARRQFEEWDTLFFEEFDLIAEIFHTIINRDTGGFLAGLGKLHPSPHDRMVSIVMLSKLAGKLYQLKHTTAHPASLWGNGRDITYLGSRFTQQQAAELWQRFQLLDEKLKLPEEKHHPGFQRASGYHPNDMPADVEVEDFIASWENSG
ncbi:phytanoyl-CoA dioxygenase family protein [Candidatus Poribacteria bacterium]|nr:phytanoyl-CoA dioxygenase family protein [Candidatus Poribacteria bacterium]